MMAQKLREDKIGSLSFSVSTGAITMAASGAIRFPVGWSSTPLKDL